MAQLHVDVEGRSVADSAGTSKPQSSLNTLGHNDSLDDTCS